MGTKESGHTNANLQDFRVTPGPYPATPSSGLGPWERFGVELILTFIVVFTHFSNLERKLLNNGSMVIGVAYAACTLAGMPMLNPARALGPAFVMNRLWDSHWVFWFGPVLGGIIAAIIHEFIFNSKRHGKRPADSIDGDSSIHSEDEPFEDNKYHPAAYRPVGSGNPNSPGVGYCPSIASTSVYSSPPGRMDRSECGGSKYKQPPHGEGIYSGTRSLYNAKISDGIYSGTKSMYTKSPLLTRANLNRSQSVYTKSQNPRDLLPKPGPLIPAQSLYPIKLGNGGHLSANIRDFASPTPNFISGIKTNDGNFVKVPQGSEHNGNGFNQNTMNFLAGRNGGSRSYHDVTDTDKSGFQSFGLGDHVTNQNVQNQHLLNLKPDKNPAENIYGIRNAPTSGIYPGGEPPRHENKREVVQGKRDCYDVPRGHDTRSETPRSQASSNFNRTAAYVKSVQNNPGFKTRDSNYDIVPSGIREVSNFNQKPHPRWLPPSTEGGPIGKCNESEVGFQKQSEKPELVVREPEQPKSQGIKREPRSHNGSPHNQQWLQQPIPPRRHSSKQQSEGVCDVLPQPLLTTEYVAQGRPSPMSSVSSNSFSTNSPNPPY
ncbi:hypothetical protein RUM44_002535 [Polyplax serrata]|uniref:Uncharacterized protein n=1 Tax=Polyplax serrata TaxID=468196 RepID=A0ABR1AGE5_POLSC